MAVHHRRRGGYPPPPWTPPPDQSDHRERKRNLHQGKSGRAIFGTQTFGSQKPPPPLSILLCVTLTLPHALSAGADIRNLCRAALMQGVASIEAATHFREVRSQDPANRQGALLEPCAPSHPGASPMDFADMSPSDLRRLVPPPVTKEDFLGHVQGMGSVTADQIQKFEEFTNKFGSGKPRA